jgi:hypothetical protein
MCHHVSLNNSSYPFIGIIYHFRSKVLLTILNVSKLQNCENVEGIPLKISLQRPFPLQIPSTWELKAWSMNPL